MPSKEPIVLALPKGRILGEVMPLVRGAGIVPESAFDDQQDRSLQFATNNEALSVIRVRSFDVATFVAFGAAQLGVAGNDVLMEFDFPELYSPLDLNIGHCRLVVAEPAEMVESDDPGRWSHVRVAGSGRPPASPTRRSISTWLGASSRPARASRATRS